MDICKGEISSERKWKIQDVSVYARDGGKLLMRKRSFSFLVLFRLPIFQFEGHTLIRWYTVHEITRYSPFILLFPFTNLLQYQPLPQHLHHLPPLTLHSFAYQYNHTQQAKVHFKYFILRIRYKKHYGKYYIVLREDVFMWNFSELWPMSQNISF